MSVGVRPFPASPPIVPLIPEIDFINATILNYGTKITITSYS
jgi:hypothetical protein